jgi:6-pyruvoyltetrahydropterin/6-carboxytetrahydropterin synthase
MWDISKDFAFDASHQLRGLREGHKCGRLHGHTYTVRVTLTGDVGPTGFVLDYGDLKPFGDWVDTHFDHQHLNHIEPGWQPSAENLARYLHGVLLNVVHLPEGVTATVGVSETPKTWATYRPDDE